MNKTSGHEYQAVNRRYGFVQYLLILAIVGGEWWIFRSHFLPLLGKLVLAMLLGVAGLVLLVILLVSKGTKENDMDQAVYEEAVRMERMADEEAIRKARMYDVAIARSQE